MTHANTSSKHPRRRFGFTLIETIVTVGLLAVLAAFVVPSVVQKAGAAEPVKVQNDLTAIRVALETFSSDITGEFPADVEDLITPIDSSDSTVARQTFTAGQIQAWKGPYIAVTVPETDNTTAHAATFKTGFNADISSVLQRYDFTADKGEVSGGMGTTFSPTSTLFVAVKVTNLTLAQAQQINKAIDGSTDVDLPVSSTVLAGTNTTGRFRYTTTALGVVTAYYLATPLVAAAQ